MMTLHAQGIIWDFDGTLFNSFKIQEELLSELFAKRGITIPTHDDFLHHFHGHLRDSIHGLSKLDGEELEGLYEEFIYAEEHHYEQPHGFYFPDAIYLMQRAKKAGLKQIIVSNRPHFSETRLGSPRNLAKRPPLEGHIERVVCGDDNDFHKPDARVLDEAEQQLGLQRQDLLVIGDQVVDAELAHNLSCPVVLVQRGDAELAHSASLPDEWRRQITFVRSLDDISIGLIRNGA